MAQSKYKLTYFDIYGRAEVPRLIFAAAGVEYDDFRMDRTEWPQLKPGTPFGQVPLLEVDGVTLCQSNAIARYLATQFGLVGKTALDRARGDMIVDCMQDFRTPQVAIFHAGNRENDPEKKAKLAAKAEEDLPPILDKIEKMLEANNGGDGYFVGEQLTWTDITVAEFLSIPSRVGLQLDLDKWSKLKALKDRVEKEPKIAAWIAKRPKAAF